MPIDSIKKLVNAFPYFFDKNEDSNFYKSQSVTNTAFKTLFDDLFRVKNSFRLNKKLWIYKQQEEPYFYGMHFLFAFPLLKSVEIYRDDELVYTGTFELSDDESFSYLVHEDFEEYFLKVMEGEDEFTYIPQEIYTNDYTLEDNVQSIKIDIYSYSNNIISNDNYHVKATTFDEYVIEKGFPENDTLQNNIYDHDASLDEFGESHNIPRKQYMTEIDENQYSQTEPPYHNRATEDDYHYMQRIINYLIKLHEIPLPCAEIWKLYGIDATLTNRERLLIRMVDMNKHPSSIIYDDDENPVDFNSDWTPMKWEHNDLICPDNQEEIFFFVNVDDGTPLRGNLIHFLFSFVNMFNEERSSENYIIVPYLNDVMIEDPEIIDNIWEFDTSDLSDENDNIFVFKVYHENNLSEPLFISSELPIILRDCRNANWYVNPTTGNDDNTGDKEHPFRTIQCALNHLDEVSNVIVLQSGTHELSNPVSVNYNCNIVSCDDAIIKNDISPKFFTVKNGSVLLVRNVGFTHKNVDYILTESKFINENTNDPLIVIMQVISSNIEITLDKSEYMINDTLVRLTGRLTDEDNNPLSNREIILYVTLSGNAGSSQPTGVTVTTDNHGMFNYDIDVEEHFTNLTIGRYKITAEYEGDSRYLATSVDKEFDVIEVPILLSSDKNSMLIGESATLTADYLPLTMVEFTFTGNNEVKTKSVMSDETGKATTTLKGLDTGTVKVTAKYGVTVSNEVTITILGE